MNKENTDPQFTHIHPQPMSSLLKLPTDFHACKIPFIFSALHTRLIPQERENTTFTPPPRINASFASNLESFL